MSRLVTITLSVLMGALISGAGAWVTWGRSIVDEPKVIELIETRSPYLYDKKLLLERLHKLDSLEDSVDEVKGDIRELKVLIQRYLQENH